MRPVPGQGLICFKCGKSHRASECSFSGTCNTCGKEGHISMVCKRNPNCIIKWQRLGSSSTRSTLVASSRGSAPTVGAPRGTVQMMAGPPSIFFVPLVLLSSTGLLLAPTSASYTTCSFTVTCSACSYSSASSVCSGRF